MTEAFKLVAERPQPIKGAYAYIPNIPHTHNNVAKVALKAGDFVKVDNTSTTVNPVVDKCLVTDIPYGMVVYDCRVGEYKAGDKVALAKTGDIVWLVANSAIVAGAKLQMVGDKVDDTTTMSNAFIGTAITKANADGDLVQVELNFNLGKQA